MNFLAARNVEQTVAAVELVRAFNVAAEKSIASSDEALELLRVSSGAAAAAQDAAKAAAGESAAGGLGSDAAPEQAKEETAKAGAAEPQRRRTKGQA